ncbi:DUF4421 family protein [Robiginitalea sediminis]|uniref:DUF4421 family protein n=1 Tax=Robiginitalea sediminis TaxID=1982593 RepID=UPI000B4B3737|nr:DUF4421 family protein [Robiginitalea sediminis]
MGRWVRYIWFLFPALAIGQSDLDTTRYFKTYPEALTLRTSATLTGNSFVFRDLGNDIRYTLNPIRSTHFQTSLQFRALELGFGFSPGWLNPDRELEGSRLFNMDFRIYAGKWMQTFTYLDQEGFRADLDGTTFYFPSFGTRKVGGSTSYVVNPKFSFRSLFGQNEWQLQSAGSFVPRLLAYYTRYRANLGEGEDTLHTFDIGIGPGYHYNWVLHERWMLSAGNTTGLGISFLDSGPETTSYWLWETQFRATLAYNTDTFFAGVGGQYTFYEHAAGRDLRLDDRIYYLQFFVGYRFRAPDSWNAAAARINRTFGWD